MSVPPPNLNGKRILVAEADHTLGTAICREFADWGIKVLGPAPTPFYALNMIGRRGVDVAVLDVKLFNSTVFDLADKLVARGTLLIFIRGADGDAIPARFSGAVVFEKPVDVPQLVALSLQLAAREMIISPLPIMVSAPPRESSTSAVDDRLVAAVCRSIMETAPVGEAPSAASASEAGPANAPASTGGPDARIADHLL